MTYKFLFLIFLFLAYQKYLINEDISWSLNVSDANLIAPFSRSTVLSNQVILKQFLTMFLYILVDIIQNSECIK